MVMPFWSPLIPPQGLACLKSFLRQHDYTNITIIDANTEAQLFSMSTRYLNRLSAVIPDSKKGNFLMIGYDVLMNHLMAHLHCNDQAEYHDAVKIIVSRNFFCPISDVDIGLLSLEVERFYSSLKEYLLRVIESQKPRVVGLSVYSLTLAPSLFACKLIKEIFPGITTVMGGGIFADHLHVHSLDFEKFLAKAPYVDKVITGEGEVTFLKLLTGELPKEKRFFCLKDVGNSVADMASLALADYSDMDMHRYLYVPTYASRGCPFHCSFCSESMYWGTYRRKKTGRIVDDLDALRNTHRTSAFFFTDSLMNPIIDEVAEEIIHRKLTVYWDVYLRADARIADAQNCARYRQAGLYRARIGVESASQRVLDTMHKDVSVEEIKGTITSLAGAGIKVTTFWVIGHPGETEDDFQASLALLDECADDIYEANPHPFYFFSAGQSDSESWMKERNVDFVYPPKVADALLMHTLTTSNNPTREEMFNRLCRFQERCLQKGIPNPYSLPDIIMADNRWKKLHNNSVPPLRAVTRG